MPWFPWRLGVRFFSLVSCLRAAAYFPCSIHAARSSASASRKTWTFSFRTVFLILTLTRLARSRLPPVGAARADRSCRHQAHDPDHVRRLADRSSPTVIGVVLAALWNLEKRSCGPMKSSIRFPVLGAVLTGVCLLQVGACAAAFVPAALAVGEQLLLTRLFANLPLF